MESLFKHLNLISCGFIQNLGERCKINGKAGYFCTYLSGGVIEPGCVVVCDNTAFLFTTTGEMVKSQSLSDVYEQQKEN